VDESALFENWVHYRGFLFNREGRVTAFVAEEGEPEEGEEKKKKEVVEKEDPIPLLRPIDEDKSENGKVLFAQLSPG